MNFRFFHFSRRCIFCVEFCIFSENFWWNSVRILRQIPEKSDVCRFFNRMCENKLENCRNNFWKLWKLFNIIHYYSFVSLIITNIIDIVFYNLLNIFKFSQISEFWIFGNFLICFRKFDWKSYTRHSFLELVAKSGQNFIKNSQKACKIRHKHEKIGNSFIHSR